MKPVIETVAFYTLHAVRETLRIKGDLFATTTIVVGICVPLLLLLGITNGLVKQQEEDMLKSPTACQIRVWRTANAAPTFCEALERRLEIENPDILVAIPGITKVVDVYCDERGKQISGLTVLCTKPGDRLLAFYHADVLKEGQLGMVLSKTAAEELGIECQRVTNRHLAVKANQEVRLVVTRFEGGDRRRTAEVTVPVHAVADVGSASVGYLHRQQLDWIEDFQQGKAVNALNWPGYAKTPPTAYEKYLCFSKDPFNSMDKLKLRANGLTVAPLRRTNGLKKDEWTLFGMLKDHDLNVHTLYAEGAGTDDDDTALLTRPADEIEDITSVDDIVVPWSEPLAVQLDTGPKRLVGVSFRKRWLSDFLENDRGVFTSTHEEFSIYFPEARPDGTQAPALRELVLSDGRRVMLSVWRPTETSHGPSPYATEIQEFIDATAALATRIYDDIVASLEPRLAEPGAAVLRSVAPRQVTVLRPAGVPSAPRSEIAVVPAPLLAHLHAMQRGAVAYDEDHGTFVPSYRENEYSQARVYAADLRSVPRIDAMFREVGYATQSERTRIEEIQEYAQTLSLLVYLVGGTVFVFGIWTLTAVLSDNTSRKRRSIGILRTMGVGPLGIFYMVALRAILIGVIGGAVTTAVAILLSRWITVYVAWCNVETRHLAFISFLAVAACVIGVVMPAYRATRTDPAEVLSDGHVQ